jgi:hypothetical protein
MAESLREVAQDLTADGIYLLREQTNALTKVAARSKAVRALPTCPAMARDWASQKVQRRNVPS